MRLLPAHILALCCYLVALWYLFAFMAGLAIYYALFRARLIATLALGIASAVIFALVLAGVFGGNGGRMMPVWAGITAAFVHHVVFLLARGMTNLFARN
jgi:hypothetical protein